MPKYTRHGEPMPPSDRELDRVPRWEPLGLELFVRVGDGDPQIAAEKALDEIVAALRETGRDTLADLIR